MWPCEFPEKDTGSPQVRHTGHSPLALPVGDDHTGSVCPLFPFEEEGHPATHTTVEARQASPWQVTLWAGSWGPSQMRGPGPLRHGKAELAQSRDLKMEKNERQRKVGSFHRGLRSRKGHAQEGATQDPAPREAPIGKGTWESGQAKDLGGETPRGQLRASNPNALDHEEGAWWAEQG